MAESTMRTKTIGLIAAMPEEVRPLLSLIGPFAPEEMADFTCRRFTVGKRDIVLVESGMGPDRAAAAAALLIDRAKPDVVVNFGFGGGVTPGSAVGDIVVAERLLHNRGELFSEQPDVSGELTERVAGAIGAVCQNRGWSVHRGTFITSYQILRKREIAPLLPAGVTFPVLEMETAAIARIAARERVPFVALRAITDGAEEELGFTIVEFTDRKMRVRLGKVLWTIARKPWIIPQLVRLARNSKVAGRNLARGLLASIRIL